jgi:glycosyltransferase involved in cell wall biosynthesis
LGIQPTTKIVLWSAKFISKKRPYDMIEAFLNLSLPNVVLIMLGDGILYEEIKQYVLKNKLNTILLPGFVNQSEIAKYYGIADIFVMTSGKGETWGLAINEALNFNIPIIISDVCGCVKDLLKDGINGYEYPVGNIQQLTSSINKVLNASIDDSNLKHKNNEILKEFSYATISENISANLR